MQTAAFNDCVDGGDGNDTIDAGSGYNTVLGGAGDDWITLDNYSGYSGAYSDVDGGTGYDRLSLSIGPYSGSDIRLAGIFGPSLERVGTWSAFDRIKAFAEYEGPDKYIETWGNNGNVRVAGIEEFHLTGRSDDLFVLKGNAGSAIGNGGSDALYVDWSAQLRGVTWNLRLSNDDAKRLANGVTVQSIERVLLQLGSGDDAITAAASNDYVDGGDGDDTIDAGSGYNTVLGGAGDDWITLDNYSGYSGASSDVDGGTGYDRLSLSIGPYSGSDIRLAGLYGTSLARVVASSSFDNIKAFAEYEGPDKYIDTWYDNGYVRVAGIEEFHLTGNLYNGNDLLVMGLRGGSAQGGGGSDTYLSRRGDDSFTDCGGTDIYYLLGRFGTDVILDRTIGDVVDFRDINAADLRFRRVGNDLIIESVVGDRVTLPDHFAESAIGRGWSFRVNGNALTVDLAARTDAPRGALLTGTTDADELNGSATADEIVGLAGADLIRGGPGSDLLRGGLGDDLYSYSIGHGNDTIDDDGGEDLLIFNDTRAMLSTRWIGNDLRITIADGAYILLANQAGVGRIERIGDLASQIFATQSDGDGEALLIVGASDGDAEDGEGGDDLMLGWEGGDTLNGAGGADTLVGADGDDHLSGGLGNDSFNGGQGADLLAGHAGRDTLAAGGGNDSIDGGDGSDSLSGGAGNDSLIGGAGSDQYVVDSAFDMIGEAALGGADTVFSSVSFTLSAELEDLVLATGLAAINGTGNASANIVTGNDGNNILTGRQGADVVRGGAGNDTLGGGEGADTLNGGAGADSLTGGLGNDRYSVDSVGDKIFEDSVVGAGVDLVVSTISWTLGSNLENLTLSGTAGISGTGNSLSNLITGNAGANYLAGGGAADTLVGGDGADTMIGGLGADRMEGGAGADVFRWMNSGQGGDRVIAYAGSADQIEVSAAGFLGAGGAVVLAVGALSASRYEANATGAATGAGARFIFNTSNQQLLWDQDGVGGSASVLLANLGGATGWAMTEITVIA